MARIPNETTNRSRPAIPARATTGHEWDGIQRTQHAAAALVAVDLLRLHRLGDRLLDRLSGLAAADHARRKASSAGTRAAPSSTDLDELTALRGPMMAKLAQASLADIEKDPQLSDFARALGRAAFADNCAPCHGAGGGGVAGLSQSQR